MKQRLLTTLLLLAVAGVSFAGTVAKEAQGKIKELNSLIKKADKKGVDSNREKCAVWFAKEFLMYADWDEQNKAQNEYQYSTWKPYKADAAQLAEKLPDFEREEVVKMLDCAIEELKGVLSGKYTRRSVPQVDWSSVKPKDNQFYSNNTPTFFNTYFTIPAHQCNEYVGIARGASLALNAIKGEKGGLSNAGVERFINTPSKYSGYVLLWHGQAPKWIKTKEPKVAEGQRLFTHYDIDNPEIRKAWDLTFKECVPYIKKSHFADLGYILANEPHWHTMEKVWATGGVSHYTKDKFRVWLAAKHKSIEELNKLWKTNFASFDEVDIKIPFEKSIFSTPMCYDWQRFNMDRVTDWFTFLDNSLKSYDADAKSHIKLIPRLFVHKYHDHGLDMEALFELTDIVGNDAKIIKKIWYKDGVEWWEPRYAFNWRDMAMSYDFFHSVNPNGPNVNSESHFLSSTAFRDIYLTKEFTRTTYWIATLHGMNASFSWFWAREKNGEVRKDLQQHKVQFDNAMNNAYVASVVQQPRVANEVTKTYMDLNAFGREIAAMQSQRRPIRIFYSETSALNRVGYTESLAPLYESLYFDGVQLGYVTKNIINKQDNKLWDVVLVNNSEFVTTSEIAALQSYLDRGGNIVMDAKSLKFDEYGRAHTQSLKSTKGKVTVVKTVQEYYTKAFGYSNPNSLPQLTIDEQNEVGKKGCMWRATQLKSGNYMLSISNMGKSDATITIGLKNGKVKSITEQLLGKKLKNGFTIPSEQTMLIEVAK